MVLHQTATSGEILTACLMWLIIREAVYKFSAITKLLAIANYLTLDSQELKVNKINKTVKK